MLICSTGLAYQYILCPLRRHAEFYAQEHSLKESVLQLVSFVLTLDQPCFVHCWTQGRFALEEGVAIMCMMT